MNDNSNNKDTVPVSEAKVSGTLVKWLIFLPIFILIILCLVLFSISRTEQDDKGEDLKQDTDLESEEFLELEQKRNISDTFVFLSEGDIWYSESGEAEKVIHFDSSSKGYSSPKISPDGKMISYIEEYYDADGMRKTRICLYDLGIMEVIEEYEIDLTSYVWSGDNSTLYIHHIYTQLSTTEVVTEIKSLDVDTGETEVLGEFPLPYSFGDAWGGGSPDPAFGLSISEEILEFAIPSFEIAPDDSYLVYSRGHWGDNIAIFGLVTQENIILESDDTRKVSVSSDGEFLITSSSENIVVSDSKTGEIVFEYTNPNSSSNYVFDSTTQNLYYTDNIFTPERKLQLMRLDTEMRAKVFDFTDYNIYSIKPIYVDNGRLLLIAVENSVLDSDQSVLYYPKVNLLELDLETLSLHLVSRDVEQAFFN